MLTGARFADLVESAHMRCLPLPDNGVFDSQPTAVALDRPPLPRLLRRWQRGRAEIRLAAAEGRCDGD